eukprot:TRINITY_DN3447_c0_g1_i1.p1 TRINITY_DN3447_c0_g1~~TRINITY_DN3447_c0_g1_i1.p1  ORF type:complete len:600 (-),score=146.46 TRINITY_DN3447_c0_g1_i1:421-2220(-)
MTTRTWFWNANEKNEQDISILKRAFPTMPGEAVQVIFNELDKNFSETFKTIHTMGYSAETVHEKIGQELAVMNVISILDTLEEDAVRSILAEHDWDVESAFSDLLKHQSETDDKNIPDFSYQNVDHHTRVQNMMLEAQKMTSFAMLIGRYPQLDEETIRTAMENHNWNETNASQELETLAMEKKFAAEIERMQQLNSMEKQFADKLKDKIQERNEVSLTWSNAIRGANESVIRANDPTEDYELMVSILSKHYFHVSKEIIKSLLTGLNYDLKQCAQEVSKMHAQEICIGILDRLPGTNPDIVSEYVAGYFPDIETTVRELGPHYSKAQRINLMEKIIEDTQAVMHTNLERKVQFSMYLESLKHTREYSDLSKLDDSAAFTETRNLAHGEEQVLAKQASKRLDKRIDNTQEEIDRAERQLRQIQNEYVSTNITNNRLESHWKVITKEYEEEVQKRDSKRQNIDELIDMIKPLSLSESYLLEENRVRPEESLAFDIYFNEADDSNTGTISQIEAIYFFQRFHLGIETMSKIWTIVSQGKDYLDRPKFHAALQLISVALSGQEPTLAKLAANPFYPLPSTFVRSFNPYTSYPHPSTMSPYRI